eukprot:CAMPEP_0194347616 /NCGR_PEP_ID=MMETSP0171-20130528/106092_1 /TAXON_ID=218684 /ORGANISM="Corethron pennatum, Strain L29A3" /LENGTH=118 /DNA_ID=CAMNT_0039114893 /DNA_START=26 /DNA_END=379 /DNA_ORIENTATION=-
MARQNSEEDQKNSCLEKESLENLQRNPPKLETNPSEHEEKDKEDRLESAKLEKDLLRRVRRLPWNESQVSYLKDRFLSQYNSMLWMGFFAKDVAVLVLNAADDPCCKAENIHMTSLYW